MPRKTKNKKGFYHVQLNLKHKYQGKIRKLLEKEIAFIDKRMIELTKKKERFYKEIDKLDKELGRKKW